MQTKQKQKIIGAVALLALLFFFLPQHFASASWWDLPTANDLIALFFQTIFGLIADVIGVTSAALNYAVSVRAGGDIPVVATTWKILRDFSNMAFIILLIYMAFATIFDYGKYTFKDMIVRFVIVAVLINFSLVIGLLIIDAVQVLTNIFLGSIGNIGDRLGQYLSPGELMPLPGKISAASLAGGGLVSLLFAVILSSILLFSMLVALVFAFIRVPIIWALLIVSPLAWMSHVLPSSEGWWKKWWNLFFGWNLFLPVYLFFIYIGLLFLSKRNEIINSVIQVGTTANPANDPLVNTLTNGLTFNLFFFYFFAAVVMVGGTWAATKTTSMMGGGFEKGLGWAKGLVKRVPLPYVGNLQAGESAYNARRAQFQQEGFKQGGFINKWTGGAANKIYGGKDAQSRADAKAGSFFGVRGADLKLQKELVDQAGKVYQDIERQFQDGSITIPQIIERATKYEATDSNGFAYRKLAAKVGQLDNNMFLSTLHQLADNPFAAQEFVKAAKEGKFSKMKGGDLALMAAAAKGKDSKGVVYDYSSLKSSVGARREMYRYVQSDIKAISGLTYDGFKAGLDIFGGHTTADGKAYLKEIGKVRPDFVANYNLSHPDTRKEAIEGFEKSYTSLPTGTPAQQEYQLKVNTLEGSLKSGDIKTTSGIPLDVWKVEQFQEALKIYLDRLSEKARVNYVHRLEKGLLDTKGGDKKIEVLYTEILGRGYDYKGATRAGLPPSGKTGLLTK